MKEPLRKLGATVAMTFVFSLPLISETKACGLPEPGQIPTPPCATQSESGDLSMPEVNSITSSDIGTPTVANDETSFNEIAAKMVLYFLPLF